MQFKIVIICAFLLMPLGCAAPGAPLIRSSEADGQGPLVEGCQNVSSNARKFALSDEFITTSYLTTWGSAWKEGAMEGYREATDQARASVDEQSVQVINLTDLLTRNSVAKDRLAERPASLWSEPVNAFANETAPFCKFFYVESSKVFSLVEELFKKLDYPVYIPDSMHGVLATEFVERKHIAARWRDRYVVMALELESDKSVLIVHRTIFIDRSGEMFNEAISVGHNEVWIINQISKGLGGNTKG